MAVIKLTEIPSFESNFKSQAATARINSLGITHFYYQGNYTSFLAVSDQKSAAISIFQESGSLHGASNVQEIKNLKSFKDLGIHAINGINDYLPELTLIDANCSDKIYVVDAKLNPKENTQHIVKYEKAPPNALNPYTLDDVVLQIDSQEIKHFAVSESRSYDPGCGGYPVTFYAINKNKEVLEFETQNYRSKIFANPQSLVWKPTGFDKKEGFVRLIENPYYWSSKEELVYAFGLEKDPSGDFFFLELVNSNSLKPGSTLGHYPSATKKIANKIKLDMGSYIDFNLSVLPKFDSASCLGDKEFLITMVPVVSGCLDTSCRDVYWFRLKNSGDEAILLADPYRVTGVDRFDNAHNEEGSICIRSMKESFTFDDVVYLITGQNEVKKFEIDLKP